GCPITHWSVPIPYRAVPIPHWGLPIPHRGLPIPHRTVPIPHRIIPITHRSVPITPVVPPLPGSSGGGGGVWNPSTPSPRVSPQDCSVLAFVLDHLLPHTQNAEDKDTPALARLFLASLAAAGSGTDAQVALVNEVKAALGRALAMAESTEKHARLQAVMCIISTIMESCPSTSSFYSSATKTQHNGMNNIIRLFLKKGLVNDLARVPHSLDLSSPNMANTVNAALKPLETLSRIVNQPSGLFGTKGSSSKSKGDGGGGSRDAGAAPPDGGDPGDPEPPEEDAEAAQAEAADGDMDGETEGDTVVLAGQPEGLSTQEMQVENELEDLIDELLERDGATGNSTIIVSRSGEDESQEDVLMDEAPSNLSQASTLQANREDSMNILDPEDEEEHTQEEDSSGSNEDEDDSQDEEEEEEEEDEDDQEGEEGEEEEDDDDGSEMELDEDYPDMNASPLVRFERFDRDDDLIIEFDNMFSSPTDIPPSPGNIPATHPLLVRHADHGSLALGGGSSGARLAQGMGRSQRTLRQLTANTGHTIHVHYPGTRQPNPPLILQRLLGPSAAADILQLSSSLPLQSRGRARLLVGNEDVHIIARSDDELLDDFFHEQGPTGSQAGTLSSIPTALTRWTEECKVLDAESMHDCVSGEGLCPHRVPPPGVPICPPPPAIPPSALYELDERREKRRRQAAEEEAKGSERGQEDKEGAEPGAQAASLSPERAEDSDALTAVSSALEGSPMDTSSLGSGPPEEGAEGGSAAPQGPPGTPQGPPPAPPGPPDAAHPTDDRWKAAFWVLPCCRRPSVAIANKTCLIRGSSVPIKRPGATSNPPLCPPQVLAQQRAEQQRRELAQATSSDAPMDPVTFIQTLPSELRRSVLEDMEDSVLAVMPPDIAAEAQALRREQEARQRQLMHERLFGHSSTSALSAILRSPGEKDTGDGWDGSQPRRILGPPTKPIPTPLRPSGSSVDSLLRLRGRLLLDHEALSCLLVLLFVDEPKLNTSRLHRVLRNLCYHAPTRGWVVRSLLSILQRSSESELCLEAPRGAATPQTPDERPQRRPAPRGSAPTPNEAPRALDLMHRVEARSSGQLSWLSVSMDAALGCRTNIFQIQRAPGRKHTEKHAAAAGSAVHIHPQAAPVVCRHVLDTLIQLAKVFPSHFTQQRARDPAPDPTTSDRSGAPKPGGGGGGGGGGSPCPPPPAPTTPTPNPPAPAAPAMGLSTDFWDLLVKLDNMNVSRKGKGSAKAGPGGGGPDGEVGGSGLEASPLGQLMNMLSHGVIRRSALLTEKLLRLLSLISIALPEGGKGAEGGAATPTGSGVGSGGAAGAGGAAAHSPTAAGGAAAGGAAATGAGSAAAGATPKSSKSPPAKGGESSADPRMAATGLTESQLQLSVEVLTSHSCSEEGLEDAANVLLQLSRGDPGTRDTVLRLLLSGARQLGATLCRQIGTLLAELREYNLEQQRRAQSEAPSPEGVPDEQPPSAKLKGKMQSRFDTAESVVIVASQKRALGGRELQLPSMSVLTSKTSTQRFFLRVLQVIIQLRDDTRRAHKKAKQAGRLGAGGLGAAGSIQAAVRQLEAEADAIIQMVREGQRARRQQQADTSEPGPADGTPRRDESPMDVDQPSPAPPDAPSVGECPPCRYFRQELERLDEGLRKEDMAVHVRRDHVFEDSYRELHRKSPEEMKNRLYIVFEGEEGQDAGGLLREWYMIISREMFNPMYALFRTSPGDRVTYTINPSSHCNPNHLSYFKFVGRIVAKAVYDNRLLECYFTRSFYKHILGKSVRYTDMESEDYHFYQGLVYLLENDVSTLGYDLTFSTEVQEFGVCEVRDLKPNGANVLVTEENKKEYVHLVCQMRMTGAIRKQLAAFLEGFYEIIPKRLISIFTEQELELLISGLPTIDIDDLKANTEYHKYQGNSIQVGGNPKPSLPPRLPSWWHLTPVSPCPLACPPSPCPSSLCPHVCMPCALVSLSSHPLVPTSHVPVFPHLPISIHLCPHPCAPTSLCPRSPISSRSLIPTSHVPMFVLCVPTSLVPLAPCLHIPTFLCLFSPISCPMSPHLHILVSPHPHVFPSLHSHVPTTHVSESPCSCVPKSHIPVFPCPCLSASPY
ncbi:E3 ubiquitin-protein ligase HUWE1-like, partial [Phasianus colchicus]|uniref:E3 ubiquitin-protein ligase HUWE1-like n=1 Tax=Phasianus colchicus TaxID=9054 RepID=UPI00129EC055